MFILGQEYISVASVVLEFAPSRMNEMEEIHKRKLDKVLAKEIEMRNALIPQSRQNPRRRFEKAVNMALDSMGKRFCIWKSPVKS